MEKGMNLSGQLADWPVDDLIQIVQVTKKTGSLDIKGERRGRIHFRDGLLTGAELHSPQGIYAGADPDTIADVVFVLGALEDGTFAMGPPDGPETEGHAADAIAASVAELRTLEAEITDAGVMNRGDVRLVAEVEAKVTLDPGSWHYLSRLVPVISVDELEERFGRGSAVRMMHSLYSIGLLAPPASEDDVEDDIGGVDESGWLEELAEEVSRPESDDWQHEEHDVEVTLEKVRHSVEAGSVRGVAADASTTLTGGVYDEIRRLRSKPNH